MADPALRQLRVRQEPLSGAADHPERLVVAEEALDEDEEDVPADVRAAAVQALRGDVPSREPLAAAASASPQPIASAPLPAAEVASPQPIAASDPLPAAEVASPQPIAASDPLPAAEVASSQPIATWLPGVARWAQVAFTRSDLAGLLLLPEDPAHAWLEVRRDGTASVVEGLFGIPVAGWIASPMADAWTPEQEATLKAYLRDLHDRLAERLPSLEPPAFLDARARLLRYLAHDPAALRARLQAASSEDAAIRVAMLSTSGGTLASLLTVWNQGAGGLPVVLPLSRDPDLETVAPVLDADAPLSFYREVLGLPAEETARPVDVAADERLLRVVRRELRLLCDRGGHRLTEPLIRAVGWDATMRELVGHNPATGATGINPNHRTIRRLLRRFDEDRTLVPMLVSSVYTAINRALEDVRDEDEIGFLQALLDSRGP